MMETFLIAVPAQAGKHALLVGISDYRGLPTESKDGLIDLKGPPNDIQLVMETLTSAYGFKNQNITILRDNQATYLNIKNTFYRKLIMGTQPGDLVTFYFSGHGTQVLDNNGDEEDAKDEALCPYDTIFKGGGNLILDDELGEWFAALKGRTVVAIIDACHSASAFRAMNLEIIERYIPVSDYVPVGERSMNNRGMDIPHHVIFMAACRESQQSHEIKMKDGFHGIFSYALCRAMGKNTLATYEDLLSLTQVMVKNELSPLKKCQKPQLITASGIEQMIAFDQSQSDIKNFQATCLSNFFKSFDPRVAVAAEIVGERSGREHKTFKKKIAGMRDVKLVRPDTYFDLQVQVKKDKNGYDARLINYFRHEQSLGSFDTISDVVNALHPYIKDYQALKQLVNLRQTKTSFQLNLKTTDENQYQYKVGDELQLTVQPERACHLLVLSASRNGAVNIIIPNKVEIGFVPKDQEFMIPTPEMNEIYGKLAASPPVGNEIIKVIGFLKPLDLDCSMRACQEKDQKKKDQGPSMSIHHILSALIDNPTMWSEASVEFQTYE